MCFGDQSATKAIFLFYFIQKMKYITFGLILIWCYVRAIEINEKYAGKNFKEFLEQLKPMLKTGDKSHGIPVLDPFIRKELPFVLNENKFKLDMLLKDINITGLSEYDVIDANLHLIGMKINMNISWPLLTVFTNYTMKGKLDVFNFNGTGLMNISAHNFAFDTEASVAIHGRHLHLRDIKLKLFLKAIDVRITGLFDDEELSELISHVLSELIPELLQNKSVTKKLEDFIMKELNIFLIAKKIAEMIKLEENITLKSRNTWVVW